MLEMELKKDLLLPDENEVIERILENSKEANNGDLTDTVKDLNDILDLLHSDPDSFIKSLEKLRDEVAETYDLCSICGEELEFVSSDEQEMYQSSPVGTMRCPNDCEA